MPIPAKPFTQECPKCGWTHTVIPVSDVIFMLPICPRCGNDELTRRAPTVLETLRAKLTPSRRLPW